ncbi:MAG TPA: transposase [Gemmatimonadales bacterium]|nr:transposase [Gemmatimonadales bacterium]
MTVFTQPSFVLFQTLVSAWVLCPGRRTVTRMIGVADPEGAHAHDAYHRFFRAGAWTMTELWRTLVGLLVTKLAPIGVLLVDLDDTLFHKAGRKIAGAGIFRDPIRSTARNVVYALGLNVVVLTVRITPPWGGEPLGLPVNVRIYRKGGPSHLALGAAMLRELATWLPDRHFALTCDGAYAALAGEALLRTHVTSRMRRDAALYLPPPPRKRGQRGRPRKKGPRLPSPEQLARRTTHGWVPTTINVRGKPVDRLLLCRSVLWYHVCPQRVVLLVIVRDPVGKQPDDFFFTTDLSAGPAAVASQYSGRWSIEDTIRATKQALGGEDPQTWKDDGPERAAALSFWIYAAVWLWYLKVYGTKPSWPTLPWYPKKCTPSFVDALAALRRTLWRERIFPHSSSGMLSLKITHGLIEILAQAA